MKYLPVPRVAKASCLWSRGYGLTVSRGDRLAVKRQHVPFATPVRSSLTVVVLLVHRDTSKRLACPRVYVLMLACVFATTVPDRVPQEVPPRVRETQGGPQGGQGG